MAFSMYAQAPRERATAEILRELCVRAIEERGRETASRQLNCTVLGLDALLDQELRWKLDVAFRVAEGLELDVIDRICELVVHS